MRKNQGQLSLGGSAGGPPPATRGSLVRARERVALSCKGDVVKTKQAPRDSTKIDAILRRYSTLGVDASFAPHLFRQGVAAQPFGVDQGKDYHAQLASVVAVRTYFDALPSRVRARFANDPGKLLAFLGDEDNREEAVKLGLVKAPVKPTVDPAAAIKPPEVKPPEVKPPEVKPPV